MRFSPGLGHVEPTNRIELKVDVRGQTYYNMCDWCESQDSNGSYFCWVTVSPGREEWVTPESKHIGSGAFYFSEHSDAMLFALRWAGELHAKYTDQ